MTLASPNPGRPFTAVAREKWRKGCKWDFPSFHASPAKYKRKWNGTEEGTEKKRGHDRDVKSRHRSGKGWQYNGEMGWGFCYETEGRHLYWLAEDQEDIASLPATSNGSYPLQRPHEARHTKRKNTMFYLERFSSKWNQGRRQTAINRLCVLRVVKINGDQFSISIQRGSTTWLSSSRNGIRSIPRRRVNSGDVISNCVYVCVYTTRTSINSTPHFLYSFIKWRLFFSLPSL